MKKIFLIVCILAMTFFLLLYPENCIKSARYGLNLWFTVVLPSLFPFMAASFILLDTGIVRFVSHIFSPATRFLFSAPGEGAYIFLMSALSGYPAGARLASELYAKKHISEAAAQSIIRFTSVSGPVFIMGAVSAGMLGIPESGAYLAAAHYLSAILTGIIFGMFNRNNIDEPPKGSFKDAALDFKKDLAQCAPFGELLFSSVEKALITLLKIGGLIIFFSVVMEILSLSGFMDAAAWLYSPVAGITGLTPDSTKAILIGGIEMTNGANAAATMNISLMQKLPVISSIIAFGGLCIHMQTRSVCAQCGLIPKYFIPAKSLQAFFAYILCVIAQSIFPISSLSVSVGTNTKTAVYCGLILAAFFLVALLAAKYFKKKRVSSTLPFTRKL